MIGVQRNCSHCEVVTLCTKFLFNPQSQPERATTLMFTHYYTLMKQSKQFVPNSTNPTRTYCMIYMVSTDRDEFLATILSLMIVGSRVVRVQS